MPTLIIRFDRPLGNLDIPKTETNKDIVMKAVENAEIRKISGHHAATYEARFNDDTYGIYYVRGAVLVTKARDINLFMIGRLDESYIDSLWLDFIDSISVTY